MSIPRIPTHPRLSRSGCLAGLFLACFPLLPGQPTARGQSGSPSGPTAGSDWFQQATASLREYQRLHQQQSGGGFSSSGGGAAWETTGDHDGAYLGYSLAHGNVNGDDWDDVIIGVKQHKNSADLVVGGVFVFYGSATGPGTDPDWIGESDRASSAFGEAVCVLDANGDGIDDLAVGAPFYDPTGIGRSYGHVFVWHGSSAGLNGGVDGSPTNAAWFADGKIANAQLGQSVGSADVNGDGFDDLLAGAPVYHSDPTTLSEGAVFLWYGQVSGLNGGVPGEPGNAGWSVEGNWAFSSLGVAVSGAGDMNGDGYEDFAITATNAPGDSSNYGRVWGLRGDAAGPLPGFTGEIFHAVGASNGDQVGTTLAGEFDCNLDGFSDFAIGSPRTSNDGLTRNGAVTVILGGAGFLTRIGRTGSSNSEQFGEGLAAGDFNGDGFDDLIVGSPVWVAPGGGWPGKVSVFHGDPNTQLSQYPDWECEGDQSFSDFGRAVASGDFNGDGNDEVLIGAYLYSGPFTDGGKVWMHLGSGGGGGEYDDGCLNPTPDQLLGAPLRALGSFGFGSKLARVNFDGDEYDDLIVGEPSYGGGYGAVFVFRGSSNGLIPIPAFEIFGEQNSALGISVAGADVDGNGYGDVIVGATGWDGMYGYVPGGAWVYYGSATGLDKDDPDTWTATSSIHPDQFGWNVSNAGDVNGNGCDDVMVAAIGYKTTFSDDPHSDIFGKVYLWYGSANGVNGGVPGTESNADWTAETDVAWWDFFGWTLAGVGDVDGDGFDEVLIGAQNRDIGDQHDLGEVYIWKGSRDGPNGGIPGNNINASWSFQGFVENEQLGASAAGADINNDGFADVILGSPGFDPGLMPRAGGVAVLYGSTSGLDVTNSWFVAGDRPYGTLGKSVSATDFNGDRNDDVIAGGWTSTNGLFYQGRTWLFFGGPSGMCGAGPWFADGTKPREIQGWRVMGADVNGDGKGDLISASPWYPLTLENREGRLSLWFGTTRAILEASDQVAPGGIVDFVHFGGQPGSPVMMFIVDWNGTPVFILAARGTLDGDACWGLSGPVPPPVQGLDLSFQTFTQNCAGNLMKSNSETVQFQ